ncbi:MAG: helix-turn-helix transcriptional regulator [Candidatus Limnocylindrales bacterium]
MRTTARTTDYPALMFLRIHHGLTVRQVAAAAHCSTRYINRIEAAARPSARVCAKYFAAVAEALR